MARRRHLLRPPQARKFWDFSLHISHTDLYEFSCDVKHANANVKPQAGAQKHAALATQTCPSVAHRGLLAVQRLLIHSRGTDPSSNFVNPSKPSIMPSMQASPDLHPRCKRRHHTVPTLKEERSASHASERRQNANRFANSLRCPTCNDGQRRRPCQRSRHRRVVPMEAACSDKPRRALAGV